MVIDEVPHLVDQVDAFESILQRAWDRELSRKPVLLILIGSNLSMMEALNEYGRPFHQRGREMVLGPLNPAEVAEMAGLPPAPAIDAALVTGGLPLICAGWAPGTDLWTFLAAQLADPGSPLLISGERSLAAEFPVAAQAATVPAAIGSGERTFTTIGKAATIGHAPLVRAIEILIRKRVVAPELPLSTTASKERRYRITDPYLRFWLYFLGRQRIDEVERARGDLVLQRIRTGRAIEPLVREPLSKLPPTVRWRRPRP